MAINIRKNETKFHTRESRENGITLVALVVSIIVLLILATVSINLVINNGILDKAKRAVDKYSEEEELEQIQLAVMSAQMKGNGLTKKNLDAELQDIFNNNKTVTEVSDYYIYQINKNYRIYKDGTVEEANSLPRNYIECEYLQSTGAWIDTGILSNLYDKFEVSFDIPENFDNHDFNILFYSGDRTKETGEGVYTFLQTDRFGRFVDGYIGKNFNYSANNLSVGNNYKIVIENRVLKLLQNDVVLNTINYTGTVQTTQTLRFLGGWNTERYCFLKFKKFTIYDGETGTIKNQLIPVLESNKIPCLYDIITEQLYYSSDKDKIIYKSK